MASPSSPPSADAEALAPGPGSPVRRYSGDVRLLATAGYTLLLQVSHPTVGAGVAEHSSFKEDPWGRLLRTLDYSYSMVYGGAEVAARTGRHVYAMHQSINGVRPDGVPYRALEPEAYAWVHATLVHSIVVGRERFIGRMADHDVEALYAEWRPMGRLVGVKEGELPARWPGLRAYFDRMVTERLEDTEAVRDVIAALGDPARPPLPLLPDALWRAARLPLIRLTLLATVGLLSPSLRDRFGAQWTRAQDLELRGLAAAARTATPLLPPPLRNVGPTYLRWRGIRSPGPRGRGRPAFATAG